MKKDDIKKSELLISGNFSDEELKELEEVLKDKDIEVGRYFVKLFEAEEIVKILFRDFDAYQILRDGFLFELLMFGIGKAISWARNKKPKAKVLAGAELRFKAKKGEIPVNFGIPADNKKYWNELEKSLTTSYLDSLGDGEIVNIYWDAKNDKINITKMKI